MSSEELSEREQRVLEHLQKAQELQVTIAEYARCFGVEPSDLYHTRKRLIRKGVLAGTLRAAKEAEPGEFMPVLIAPGSAAQLPSPVCRIRHPSGLEIECTEFPPVSWLSLLLPGARDVPA